MQSIKLLEKARLERESWSPESAESEFVWHFSIPNFDDGAAKAEAVATIKSGKTLITKPCVLVSKLNPKTPRVWLVENLNPGVNVCSTEFLVVSPVDEHDLRYLYFVLKSPSAVSRLAAVASGSSTSHQRVRPSEVEALELDWEDSGARRKWVADCLWEIEEKIRANNETSRTLEELAGTLFKSWFIDFDPVKAKMAREAPVAMDAETAALFPSSLEDSELGDIPSGWKVVKVEELLIRIKAKGLAKSTPLKQTGKTLVLEQGDSLVAGFLDQDADVHATPALPKFIFGDHTCRMRLSTIPFSVLPNTIVLDSNDFNPYWAFQATRGLQNFETYRRHWMEFAQKTVAVPSKHITEKFGEIVAPLYSQMDNLMLESRKLAEVRDALLPGLISGEIEIPDELLDA